MMSEVVALSGLLYFISAVAHLAGTTSQGSCKRVRSVSACLVF